MFGSVQQRYGLVTLSIHELLFKTSRIKANLTVSYRLENWALYQYYTFFKTFLHSYESDLRDSSFRFTVFMPFQFPSAAVFIACNSPVETAAICCHSEDYF